MTIRRNVGQVTKGAVAVGQRSAGRIIGKTCEHVPTGCPCCSDREPQRDCRRDRHFHAARRNLGQPPALSARDDSCAVPLRSSAKSLEHRIAYRMRWRDRDNLVRARLGGRWRLLTARLVLTILKLRKLKRENCCACN